MLTVLLATLALVALVMVAMAVGTLITGRNLRGSCGGAGGDCLCDHLEAEGRPRPKECEGPPLAQLPTGRAVGSKGRGPASDS